MIRSIRYTVLVCLVLISGSSFAQFSPVEGSRADMQKRQQQRQRGNPLADLFAKTTVPSKIFPIDVAKGATLVGDGGTKVIIPPNAFVDQQGNPVTGTVDFEFKEVVEKADILLSNVPTVANGQLLESKGVVYLDAEAEGQKVKIAPDKSIDIEFAKGSTDEGMQGFSGKYDRSGNMNWTPQESPLTADPKTLMFKDGKHHVKAYLISLIENCSQCRGSEKIEVKVAYDIATGRTDKVRTIGYDACFAKSIADILQYVVWRGEGQIAGSPDEQGEVKFDLNINLFSASATPGSAPKGIAPDNAFFHYDPKHEDADDLEVVKVMASSTVTIKEMGWVNWDKYKGMPNPTDFIVKVKGGAEKEFARVFLAYKEVGCVIDAKQTGTDSYRFGEAPAGVPGYLVGMSYRKGQAYFAVQSLDEIGEDAKLSLKAVSIDELKSEVKKYVN